MDGPGHALGAIAIVMRRQGWKSIDISYAELSAEPIMLSMEEFEDGSIRISFPENTLSQREVEALQREACAAGHPITRAFDGSSRKRDLD